MPKNEFICDCNVIHKDLVDNTLKNMPDEKLLKNLSDFFKIIGDNTRTKILYALDQNELCVCDIASVVKTTQSAISHQLRVLKQAKLVKYRKEGKIVYYSLDDNHVSQILMKGREHVEEI